MLYFLLIAANPPSWSAGARAVGKKASESSPGLPLYHVDSGETAGLARRWAEGQRRAEIGQESSRVCAVLPRHGLLQGTSCPFISHSVLLVGEIQILRIVLYEGKGDDPPLAAPVSRSSRIGKQERLKRQRACLSLGASPGAFLRRNLQPRPWKLPTLDGKSSRGLIRIIRFRFELKDWEADEVKIILRNGQDRTRSRSGIWAKELGQQMLALLTPSRE